MNEHLEQLSSVPSCQPPRSPQDGQSSQRQAMPAMSRFAAKRTAVARHLHEIGRIARMVGLSSLTQRIDATQERLQRDRLTLAVVGEFSAGKSSLVNALFGSRVLPTAAKVCTAVPTRVRAVTDGESPFYPVVDFGGTERDISKADLDQVLSFGQSGECRSLVEVEIGVEPDHWLHANLEMVDTPGVNDAEQQQEQEMQQKLEEQRRQSQQQTR